MKYQSVMEAAIARTQSKTKSKRNRVRKLTPDEDGEGRV